MEPHSAGAGHPELEPFILELGKALSRIHLYSPNHPMVKESISTAHGHLAACLSAEPEFTLAAVEDKLLLNGSPLGAAPTVQQALGAFFQKFGLQSMTFRTGVTEEELAAFCALVAGGTIPLGDADRVSRTLAERKIEHIGLNVTVYSKVGEGEGGEGGGRSGESGTGTGNEGQETEARRLIQKMEDMPLDRMLREVIRKAVPNPEDQKKIYDIIFKQLQDELAAHVERATQQLRSEKQTIQNEKERTETVINQMAEGVVIVDAEGRIVMMNPAAERIYGKSLTELKGKKVDEVISEELMVAMANDLAIPSDRRIEGGVSVQSAASTLQTLRNSTAKIEDPEGKIVGMLSILSDIAKQRELQRMQDDFLANVTHELRSPLTALKASIGALLDDRDNPPSPQSRQILTIATRNIDRLARLINDILDFGKGAAGKISLSLKPQDCGDYLSETVQNLGSWAKSKGVDITLSLPDRLPRVMADRDRSTQILVNLLSNAVKFTPQGGDVTVSAETLPLFVKVRVTDTGPGIPKAEREKLFQKFFQLKRTVKTDTPGTGLGLYITKMLVELHGGEIGFISAEGKGSTFYFTLPIVPEKAPASAAGATAAAGSAAGAPRKKGWLARLFGG